MFAGVGDFCDEGSGGVVGVKAVQLRCELGEYACQAEIEERQRTSGDLSA